MTKLYRMTCPAFTVDVEVNDSRVIQRISPNASQFRGQSLDLVLRWMGKNGEVQIQPITTSTSLFDA